MLLFRGHVSFRGCILILVAVNYPAFLGGSKLDAQRYVANFSAHGYVCPPKKNRSTFRLGLVSYGCFHRGGPPKSSILIGFSIIFSIHFGGFTPIFGNTQLVNLGVFEEPFRKNPSKLVKDLSKMTGGLFKAKNLTHTVDG